MSNIITTLHPENNEETNLYPNIKKENIPNKSIDINKLGDDVINLLNGLNQPKYVSTLPTNNQGLVVYSDGYLYSWNGTQYANTNIQYQATQIADKSISGDKLTTDLITNLSNIEMPFFEHNGYLNGSGNYAETGNYHSKTSYKIKCNVGDKFLYKGIGRANGVSALFYNNDTILSNVKINNQNTYTLITIPDSCNYVIFSSFVGINDVIPFSVYKYNEITDLLISTGVYQITGNVIKKTSQNGYLYSNGNYAETGSYHSVSITKLSCKQGDKFLYKGIGRGNGQSVLFYQDNTILSYNQYNTPDTYTLITIPENCNYVTFSSFTGISDVVSLDVYLVDDFLYSLYIESENSYKNVLSLKNWYAYGDSFTIGDFSGLTPSSLYTLPSGKYAGRNAVYPYIIGNRTNCNVYNQAQNGLLLQNFINNETYKLIPLTADYITFYFGINDSHANIPIGTIDDETSSTFYGCWNILIKYLFDNGYTSKIGIIISNGCDTTAYPEATINIAKKYGLSYLDINGDDKLPMVIRANMRNLSNDIYDYYLQKYAVVYGTNNHPNVLAHEDESYMIQQWLERL